MKTELLEPTPDHLRRVNSLLQAEQVVALPTETVYGLAGNAFSENALRRIFEAKQRPFFDPLIVHIANRFLLKPGDVLRRLSDEKIIDASKITNDVRDLVERLIQAYWPGPLTLILPRGEKIPDLVTAGQDTVGIRCPAHPLFQAILGKLSFPLAAPSANSFGRISPTEARHVETELSGRIPAILDGGKCSVGLESTILRVETATLLTLLRPGQIGSSELENKFQVKVEITLGLIEGKKLLTTPGSLDEHYAPKKKLYVFDRPFNEISSLQLTEKFASNHPARTGILSMTRFDHPFSGPLFELSTDGNSFTQAQTLYRALRNLDENPDVDLILSDVPANSDGLSAAIRDRLKRASFNKPAI